MSNEDRFTISEVASMVGLTAHTIRAWERRFGIPKPGRSRAGQRRYTVDDVELLRRVRQGIALKALSLKLAVRWALGELPETEVDVPMPTAVAADEPPADGVPWRAMADIMPAPMLIVDSRGRIVDANIAFARAAGEMRGALRNTRFADLIDPHDRAKAVKAYRPPLRQRKGWELNVKTKMVAGLYSFDCWPLRRGDEWLLGMVGRALNDDALLSVESSYQPVPAQARIDAREVLPRESAQAPHQRLEAIDR